MENNKYITVFGATGKIGMELLRFLSAADIKTIAVTRDKNKAVTIPCVDWVEADMANKESLYKAMNNTKAVFLLSGHSNSFVEEQGNVIEVAKEKGVGHIVKLSSGAVDKDSPFYIPGSFIAKVHGEVEALLKTSDIPWTLLQPNGFMQNWLGELAQTVKHERKIYEATGDGKRAYLDIRDIAEVAFRILINPEPHAGKAYLLTGGQAVNFTEIAAIIGAEIGEVVEFIPLNPGEAHQRMEKKGMPAVAVQSILAYAEAQRNNQATYVSPAVSTILNKPARTVKAFVEDHVTLFK
ncbi:NmrA family NAD(P)-binding protein [Mucilaginibacter lappiensis]|uniref:Uncharacterized protein YbjT (DUF2867 family) n=1 Tax=Mucilaginibacter lappiensis TaxID=354630 RepID=A0A841J6T9_9SPHI|nr:NmrA family NAD(P)-binding protein [Mucilaginibacter lappiensis]MBB6126763.1 uncharacterized protein YbjT (DUF2867 family) [Mucilaginibacter lappiensis]